MKFNSFYLVGVHRIKGVCETERKKKKLCVIKVTVVGENLRFRGAVADLRLSLWHFKSIQEPSNVKNNLPLRAFTNVKLLLYCWHLIDVVYRSVGNDGAYEVVRMRLITAPFRVTALLLKMHTETEVQAFHQFLKLTMMQKIITLDGHRCALSVFLWPVFILHVQSNLI